MVRTSARLSSNGTKPSGHKRNASSNTNQGNHKKAKGSKSQRNGNAQDDEDDDESMSQTADEDDQSDFEDEDDVSSQEDEVDEASEESDASNTPRKRTSTSKRKSTGTNMKEVWKPGVKTGLGPGTQVIIKKPKARPAGKTPYTEDTIHPNTLLFLGDLKANNNRQWLKLNEPDFRASEKDWFGFVEKMTEKLTSIDDTIPELPVKDVIFRIYRDVRFSKDPTPYKPFFSVAWSRSGRKGSYAHYYLQIGPQGRSFIGGGLWHPDAAPTAALRRAIDRRSRHLKDVLLEAPLRKEFLENAAKNDKAVVKAFVKGNAENALKTKPKGFDADHPEIDLLRLRNFVIGRKLQDEEVLGERGVARVAELLTHMQPFITYLNSVVMPDDEPEDESEDDEEGEEDENDMETDDDDGEE